MTSHRIRRCNHCGRKYSYQASGGGCFRRENSGKYCPTCAIPIKDAIKAAKAKIRILFTEEWVETEEVTEELLWDYLESVEKERAKGKLIATRIWPGLYKMNEPYDYMNIVAVPHKGKTYRFSYWRGTKEVEKIEEKKWLERI